MTRRNLAFFALLLPALAAPAYAGTARVSWEADVKPVLDRRCVVCHSCYDAPCQLQLSSAEGADRGASKAVVYQGDRIEPMKPTRLFIDEKTTDAWRRRDFYSVLRASEENGERQSLIERMLELARAHPLPANEKLPESIDLTLDRALSCPSDAEFDRYAEEHPFGGMPYGVAPLADSEYATLVAWVRSGAPMPRAAPVTPAKAVDAVAEWEAFLNGESAKQQVTSRYLYEHLCLAHLYFVEAKSTGFFRLVRSRTPSGEPVDEIATVRPYDPPGTERFYYRLQPVRTTIVDKTHMPYALGKARMARYRELFLQPEWESESVPSYDGTDSANAFVTFAGMPARSRYRFLLDDAQYFIMTFMKGPVCRGQVALNVVDDHFFVAFLDPDSDLSVTDPEYLGKAKKWLKLPAENKSHYKLGGLWIKYLVKWRDYVDYRAKRYREKDPQKLGPSLDDIWDGDGKNDNALLTVFRHFDSASVSKGYVGAIPKTAWIVDYPILERIYYDLVAGFNVFGNVVHQLSTRLYMDYLRMESEDLFLSFLPADAREKTRDAWYAGAAAQTKAFLENRLDNLDVGTRVPYRTSDPKSELIELILAKMKPEVRGGPDPINRCTKPPCVRAGASAAQARVEADLHVLAAEPKPFVRFMPDLSVLRIRRGAEGVEDLAYSLIRNKEHANVAFMFFEEDRRRPEADTLTIVPGHVGSYPNFFFEAGLDDVDEWVSRLLAVKDEEAFTDFVEKYGIRRSSPRFWPVVDWHQARSLRDTPLEAGLLDLNRYDDY